VTARIFPQGCAGLAGAPPGPLEGEQQRWKEKLIAMTLVNDSAAGVVGRAAGYPACSKATASAGQMILMPWYLSAECMEVLVTGHDHVCLSRQRTGQHFVIRRIGLDGQWASARSFVVPLGTHSVHLRLNLIQASSTQCLLPAGSCHFCSATMNSSWATSAWRRRPASVPILTSLCMGTTQPLESRFITTWLPLCRIF
jgi:hypothetical protein